jgi:hypothetical protein
MQTQAYFDDIQLQILHELCELQDLGIKLPYQA